MSGSSSTRNPDGWTWVFGKNSKQQSKPIGNPFVKDVEKIATSFFVTNFPESLDAKNLWKEFQPYGRIVDAFIANKRSKIGKRFGFVRFLGIRNGEEFAKTLSNIWIGSHHVFVSIAKFQRQAKNDAFSTPKESVGPNYHTHAPPDVSYKGPSMFPSNHSYASVANGNGTHKGASISGVQDRRKSIQLIDQDLIKVVDTSTVALVKVKKIDSMNNLYAICKNEGFNDIKIHYVGGLWVWIQFENEKTCDAFKTNGSLKSLWASIKTVSPSFTVDERLIWIEIKGLPLCAWGSNALKKVTSMFGKFKFFDTEAEDIMSMGRVCIATSMQSCISETVSVIVHGKTFDVHVKEVGTWSTRFINESDSSDSEEKFSEEESCTSNEDECPNDVLDDFIDHMVEEKGSSNSTDEVQLEKKKSVSIGSDSIGSKPPSFEKVIEEGQIPDLGTKIPDLEGHSKEEAVKGDSDASISPGFESLVKSGKDDHHSPYGTRVNSALLLLEITN
ncbi:RNA-directed DNA polymerase, eukaryota, reverse transcriptase zinc-binding domain protein [Tanacetum coccineum]